MINTVDPVTLSDYVVSKVTADGFKITPLKLQKLLYYIDAWHSVYFDKPLFEEDFEAWVHGPVIREVFDYYKEDYRLHDNITSEDIPTVSDDLSPEQLELIDDVLDEYGGKSGYYLECLTHDEKPWKDARRGYGPSDRCEEIINKRTMKEFYSEMVYG